MADLLERVRRAREMRVTVGAWTFVMRRPTDAEAMAMAREDIDAVTLAQRFGVGWEVVTEADVVPGGTGAPAPWSPELWAEFVADHPECWAPCGEGVIEAYGAHQARREALGKPPASG